MQHQNFRGVWRDTAATPAKRYKIQEVSCDTCSATRVARQGVPAIMCNSARWSGKKKAHKLKNLDGPIRANRFADSRESPDSRESFRGSRIEPLFCESHFERLKIANRRFEAIRANRSHIMKIGGFLRIDSRESPRFGLRIAGPSKFKKNPRDTWRDKEGSTGQCPRDFL